MKSTLIEIDEKDETEDFLSMMPIANPDVHKPLWNKYNTRNSIIQNMRNLNREQLKIQLNEEEED